MLARVGGGFVLPDSEIKPTGEENFEGVVVFAERLLEARKEKDTV